MTGRGAGADFGLTVPPPRASTRFRSHTNFS